MMTVTAEAEAEAGDGHDDPDYYHNAFCKLVFAYYCHHGDCVGCGRNHKK